MYNWRLLLFAFFAFLHPIASFTERNHVDGSQCCDHRISRDTRSLNGNHPFKLSSESRLDSRGESRDEYRNALITRSSTDQTREATERAVIRAARDSMTRFTRTDTRRMSSRDTVLDQRARITRDLQRNVNDRERNQANLISRESRLSVDNEHRDHLRTGENKGNRVLPQREERRLNSNGNGEIHRFQEVRRETRHVRNRVNNRPETERFLGINTRRTIAERVNNRDFSRQGDSRVSQRLARSSDRLFRTAETRQSSLEAVTADNNERRVERENVRGVRNNIQNEISFRERVSVRRSQPARQRFDNTRDVVLRKSNEARDARVRQEIRNEDRSYARQVSRERINTERVYPSPQVAVRHIEIATQREDSRGERNNNQNEFRFSERVDVLRSQLARQRYDNNRNDVSRRSNEARDARVEQEIRNAEQYSERRLSRERINTERLSSTPRVEVRRMEINAVRRSERLTRERRSFDDISRSRLETRTRSMDNIRTDKQEERENHRMSSRLNNNVRITAERRQPTVDTRLTRNEAREEQPVRRNIDSQLRYVRADDESRRQREDRRESLGRRDIRERATRTFEDERLLARREMRERSRSLDAKRDIRAETDRNVLLQRHAIDSQRNDAERRFRGRSTSDNRLSSRRIVSQELARNRNSERIRYVSRMRNVENALEKKIVFAQMDINKMSRETNEENWQYLRFTLQGIYLCFMLLPLLIDSNGPKTKAMSVNWRAPFQKLIKVE